MRAAIKLLESAALRRWLRRPGASPAQLIAIAKHFAGVGQAIRKALEVLL